MKYIRYQDRSGKIHYGAEQADGSARRIDGDILGPHELTSEKAEIAKLLAPIAPVDVRPGSSAAPQWRFPVASSRTAGPTRHVLNGYPMPKRTLGWKPWRFTSLGLR